VDAGVIRNKFHEVIGLAVIWLIAITHWRNPIEPMKNWLFMSLDIMQNPARNRREKGPPYHAGPAHAPRPASLIGISLLRMPLGK